MMTEKRSKAVGYRATTAEGRRVRCSTRTEAERVAGDDGSIARIKRTHNGQSFDQPIKRV